MIWLISILFYVQIIADALGDSFGFKARTPALYWKYNNLAQHICQGAEVVIWLAIIYLLTKNWLYPVIYVCIRAITFNPVYNVLTGQKFWYIGNTAIIDKIINWIKSKIT
jgi:hypothetical protein